MLVFFSKSWSAKKSQIRSTLFRTKRPKNEKREKERNSAKNMEGKNCFRTLWRQTPLYSGDAFTSLLLPIRTSTYAKSLCGSSTTLHPPVPLSSHATHLTEECMVLPCGSNVNVVSASTGEVRSSFALPTDDVILCVDAVTIPPRFASFSSVEEVDVPQAKKVKRESTWISKEEVFGSSEDEEENTPPGSYIAIGTRNRQIYVIRVQDSTVVSDDLVMAQTEEVAHPSESGEKVENVGQRTSTELRGDPIEYHCMVVKQWTAAQQAISSLCFSLQGHLLVSGSTDGGIKIWNVFHHHLTHNLSCPGGSLIHAVYLTEDAHYLLTGGFEGHVSVFDLKSKQLIATARPHVQVVEALSLRLPEGMVYSIGRDRKMSVLQLLFASPSSKKSSVSSPSTLNALQEKRSIVVKEHLSCATFEGQCLLHTGSEEGVVTTYTVEQDGRLKKQRTTRPDTAVHSAERAKDGSIRFILPYKKVKGMEGTWDQDLQMGSSSLLVADSECHIRLLTAVASPTSDYSIEKDSGQHYAISYTLVGFCDQVLELHLLPSSLAPLNRLVVTNSRDVRLFDGCGSLSSCSLQGHRDIVMSAAVSKDGRLIATAGKDLEVRFWSTSTWDTVAVGEGGHTADITALRFNSKQMDKDGMLLLFSISADENLRLWDAGQCVLPHLAGGASPNAKAVDSPHRFSPKDGVNSAHAGPLYTMEVAPNDQYVATGGKDKVVNLWAVRGKKMYKEGVLRGHRRGITSLAFSTVERVLASASNDGTVRLWSIVSLTCLKTLQADKVAVLQVALFNKSTQAVTTNAEGVVRVWALGVGEVVWSGEVHEDKIWALTVGEEDMKEGETESLFSTSTSFSSGSLEEQDRKSTEEGLPSAGFTKTWFLTGGADGVIVANEDCTAEEVQRIGEERRDIILKEQELENNIRRGNFKDAFILALHLDHPRHLRQVVGRWIAKDSEECAMMLKKEICPSLSSVLTIRLLQFVREWLTNSRHCTVGSVILRAFMSSQHFYDMAKMPSMRPLVEPLLAYSRKHSQRFHELLYKSYYIDYVTRNLSPPMLTTEPPYVVQSAKQIKHVDNTTNGKNMMNEET